MPRLSKNHDMVRRRLIDLAAAGYSPMRLGALMMEALQDAVGWDGYRLFGLDDQTLLVNRLLAASDNDADARLEFLREVYLTLETEYAEIPEIARNGLGSVAFQERQEHCWGFPLDQLTLVHPADHYRHFHEKQSPVGGALIGIFMDGPLSIAAFQAYRRDNSRQFRQADITFINLVSPIIGRALGASLTRERAMAMQQRRSGEEEASGILMVDRKGKIRYASPAGERWLDTLGRDAEGLPTAVWSAMGHLRSGRATASSVVTVPMERATVRIEASCAGEPDVTAIVIARRMPPPVPDVPVSWQLTPQERQVVEQLATGKGNREIAEALFIGEHTVEWHLRKVYDKIGVRSRQGVMNLLFREVFLPGVEVLARADSVA